MKAIQTKISHGGRRVSASDLDGNRVSGPYLQAASRDENHASAAESLCAKMGWKGRLVGGHIAGGMVFVWLDENAIRTVNQ